MSIFSRLRSTNLKWVAGVYELPRALRAEDGSEVKPRVAIFAELPEPLIVGSFAIDPRNPEQSFGAMALSAMKNPLEGKPRRPASIRVDDVDLATELLSAVGDDIGIAIGPTPELDEIYAELAAAYDEEFFPPPEETLSELLPAQLVGELFEVARELFRATPWKKVREDQLVKLDFGDRGGDAVVGVLGQRADYRGMVLSRSADISGRAAVDQDRGDDQSWEAVTVVYAHRDDVPDHHRRDIETHGWKVAGRQAWPFFSVMSGSDARIPREEEARILIDAIRALLGFYRVHANAFHRDEVDAMRVDIGSDRAVDVSGPWMVPDSEEEPDEDAIYAEIDERTDAFRESNEAKPFLEHFGEEWESTVLPEIGDFAFNYFDARLTDLAPDEVDEIVFTLFPRKVTVGDADLGGIWNEMIAVWRWLASAKINPNATAVLEMLEGREDEFVEAMTDEDSWGPAKALATGAIQSGVDLSDEEAMSRYVDEYNDLLESHPAARPPKLSQKAKKNKRKMEKKSRRKNRR